MVSSARNYSSNVNLRHLCFQSNIPAVSAETLLYRLLDPQNKHHLGDVLESWGLLDKLEFLADVPVLWMPECIVELMSRDKQWATVVLNLESHRPTTRRTNLAALRFLKDQMGWPSDLQFQALCNAQGSFAVPPSPTLDEERAVLA